MEISEDPLKISVPTPRSNPLSQNLFHNVAVNVGQSEIATGVLERQSFVIEPPTDSEAVWHIDGAMVHEVIYSVNDRINDASAVSGVQERPVEACVVSLAYYCQLHAGASVINSSGTCLRARCRGR